MCIVLNIQLGHYIFISILGKDILIVFKKSTLVKDKTCATSHVQIFSFPNKLDLSNEKRVKIGVPVIL